MRRVEAVLREAGLEVSVQVLDVSARTAADAAQAVGSPLGAIVKSLVFAGQRSGRPLLALVSGANQADVSRLEARLGEPVVRPDAQYVRAVTGFAIGGVPPLAHDTPLAPLIDEDLMAHETVWCAAGTPTSLFAIAPADLVRITRGELAALALPGQASSPSSS